MGACTCDCTSLMKMPDCYSFQLILLACSTPSKILMISLVLLTTNDSYICLSIYLPIYLSIYLPICLSIYLSIYLFIYLSICLSIYLFISLSICLSVCLSVCWPLCLSVCLKNYLKFRSPDC